MVRRRFREELMILLLAARPKSAIGSVFGEGSDSAAVELAVLFLQELERLYRKFANSAELNVGKYGDVSMRWEAGGTSLEVGVTTDGQYVTQTGNADGPVVSGISTEMDAALRVVKSFVEKGDKDER